MNSRQCPKLNELPPPSRSAEGWPWTIGSKPLPEFMPDGTPWPRVTIVTPSFNQDRFLEETIRSVLLQNYPRLEYIIIDGKSSDKSVEIIKKYEPWIAYWVSEPDKSHAEALNKGWKKARSGIWGTVNSDDTYFPNVLQKAVTALMQNPSVKVVYASAAFTDKDGKHLRYYRARPLAPGLQRMQYWKGWHLPHESAFFDSRLVKRFGGMDERFSTTIDYEFFIRLSRHVRFKCIDDTWVTYRLHRNSKTKTLSSAVFNEENRRANRLHTNALQYAYLRFQERLYNFLNYRLKRILTRILIHKPFKSGGRS